MKQTKTIKTFVELKEWVWKMMNDDNRFIYRGQGDSKWLLESTFTRKNQEIKEFAKNGYFLFLIEFFKEKNQILKKELGNDINNLSLLGKMQHYGKQTPLIDFTEDILVSLWFAASYSPENNPKHFKIFFLKTSNEEYHSDIDYDEIKFDKNMFFKFKTNQKFGRSISQKSVFIFDNLNRNSHSARKIEEIKIEYSLQFEIIEWLNKFGINANSLFPDEDGVFQNFDILSSQKFFLDGLKLSILGKNNKAIEKYERATKIDPNNAGAYSNWGVILDKQEKIEEAIKKYQKAIEIDPNHADAYSNWGVVLNKQGKFEEAIKKYQKAIEIDPNHASAYSNWGVILDKQEKFEEAIKKYQKAIEIDPNHARAYFNWGVVLDEQGKFKEAIKKFEKVIEINPKDTGANQWIHNLKIKIKDDEVKK